MIEVFKTNVRKLYDAKRLLGLIHKKFRDYKANFDLKDCDKILRVQSINGFVQPRFLVELLREYGFDAEPLPDEVNTLIPDIERA